MGKDAPLILGLDVGTSECKATLVSATGQVVYTGRHAQPTHCPRPLWAEQDPQDWQEALISATRSALAGAEAPASRIAGIALTSAAHVGVLLDRHGLPVRRAILWNDQRSAEEAAALGLAHGDEIFQLSYHAVSTSWTLPHLLWVHRHEPEAWGRVSRVMLSKDWIVQWLAGRAVTDPATALSSQLMDARTGEWSADLCDLAGISAYDMPEIQPPTHVAGGLTKEASVQLGLLAGTPVVVGTLDSAAEMCAAGALEPGQCVVRLATAGGVQLVLPEARPNRRLISYPHPIAPRWYCQAGTNSCASAVRWATSALTGGQKPDYAAWDEWAASAPAGSDGLMFHPYLLGERAPHWDPELRASFVGLTMTHTTPHFARAVYEGTAFSIRDAMSALDEIPADEPLTAIGGGTMSKVWVQIVADVVGRSLHVAGEVDSAYGAALLGMVGLGMAGDLKTLAASQRRGRRIVSPIPANVQRYNDAFRTYIRVHDQLAPIYRKP